MYRPISFKHICWEIGIAEKKSVEHSFCAKQCVMIMEKIALKERCWLFVAVIVVNVDAFHIECTLCGNLANIQHTTQVTC